MNYIKLTSVTGTTYIVNLNAIAYIKPYHDNSRACIYFISVETDDSWMREGVTIDEESTEKLLRYIGTETIL